ncbi:hypothetical protein KTN05_14225 [Paracoccus sp. Z118]|uniref:DnaA N-terminal domain-containing protein n=1 Tax=Paracoccus sp. Z118 TaxID=2851017 RepID=UPI001C2CAD6E|nr:DnaA N-terminal domain-containing protein [Paracoccus sp. Z118]MBV0892992.1 hypothetical protein [Paracoccus sp. Z118]
MQVIRPVGREAASRKYDLLSALMAHGLAGDKHRQRLVLRLMALITTRYNWQRDELTMAQTEIARLWSVDERTVKRDMARLRALGWIVVKRQGARGRVSVLGLGLERLLLDTRPEWSNVGPDFVARLGGGDTDSAGAGQGGEMGGDGPTVVPFRRPGAGVEPAQMAAPGGIWAAARALLLAEDPAVFDAWLAPLAEAGIEDGQLVLLAPSRFHASYVLTNLRERLSTALRRADPTLAGVMVRAG